MRIAVCMCLAAAAVAFVRPEGLSTRIRSSSSSKETSLHAQQLTEKEKKEKYWQGDWVCADCGYVYDRKLFGGRYFEEQTYGFKCPQRYAKMVGDTVGVTLDGGDGPILFWSGFGFLVTIAFGIWATYDFPGLN
ncbi:hypothetical protein CTAYLR_010617 [Chrysophaeum taylorii]|uniref:Rubredoxin-like domain-containing protein n=1 Tax=Chrysophaeum taylorii TaxID=2483200 RepID=A0AAD7XJM7_9STRA|nr:hypothetical protein CTAYLR_010617 [Chrysophaeum taylorii]